MFLYWDGFEIDGSDTDFDIVLPENVQMHEFVECFLNIPLFCNVPPPEFSCCTKQCSGIWHDNKCKAITVDELKNKLLAGDYSEYRYGLSATINCLHPDLLTEELRTQIYAQSEGRKFNDDPELFPEPEKPIDYSKVESPCDIPVIQTNFDRGGVTMQLLIYRNDKGENSLTLNVGPSSYYEYTIYVLKYIRERFPGIEVDVENGLNTCGCTFGRSLYAYEKVLIPIKHSISHTLKWFVKHGIMSYREYFDKRYKRIHDFVADGFFVAADYWNAPMNSSPMAFGDYIELVELATSDESDSVRQMFTTAVTIMLPPTKILDNTHSISIEKNMWAENYQDNWKEIWLRSGFMSFYEVDGEITCEMRINSEGIEYFQTWLSKAESGVLDFLAPQMYKLREQ